MFINNLRHLIGGRGRVGGKMKFYDIGGVGVSDTVKIDYVIYEQPLNTIGKMSTFAIGEISNIAHPWSETVFLISKQFMDVVFVKLWIQNPTRVHPIQ